MLTKTPSALPPLEDLLHRLGRPHPRVVAKTLGVSERTVWHWQALNAAPRPATLALFWVSDLGFATIDSDREYLLQNTTGLAAALTAENAALRAEMRRVVGLHGHGAANGPSWQYVPVPPLRALERRPSVV